MIQHDARRPAVDPVDVATDACARFATHPQLLAHQLDTGALTDNERERLAAALAGVQWTVAQVSAAVDIVPSCDTVATSVSTR
ncbi:hypothetical protein HII36_11380 [Nonomuraea sp. NN258]|uniref:hypothetical protein n=1 Tax=Nonomuraea antri TaxID=2730852 RepID=UPI0015690C87|nr:hypothetical protein [Nonomuraea antri]NRQ32436.1 hypothetical protein [Nonomuraea antri]